MSYSTTVDETTVHVIGRCPVKGCRSRRRNTYPGVVRRDRWQTWTEWQIPAQPPYGSVSAHLSKGGPKHSMPSPPPSKYLALNGGHAYERAWFDAIKAAGWICVEHDRFMVTVEVKGVHREDKTCDGRCRSATGPDCECPCAGEQHGANYATATI